MEDRVTLLEVLDRAAAKVGQRFAVQPEPSDRNGGLLTYSQWTSPIQNSKVKTVICPTDPTQTDGAPARSSYAHNSQIFRHATAGRIDRSEPVDFTFDGRRLQGFRGDTLASALLANGIRLVARSFKYHRPRGIMTAGAEEPCALVQVGEDGRSTPNLRATQVELYPGLVARSINAWPSLTWDARSFSDPLGGLLAAGFYYKTFMGPPGWMFYERLIRRAAGLGRGTRVEDPDRYEKRHAHCDVLVVGGGPAGLAAALAAGRAGARVILIDERKKPSFLTAKLVSQHLAFADLAPLVGAPPGKRGNVSPQQRATEQRLEATGDLFP